MPRLTIDERLSRLRDVTTQPDLNEVRDAAVKALSDSCNLIVAEAAKIIGQFAFDGTESALLAAWERLFKHADPIKADKGCTAKTALIEVLNQRDYDDPDLFLAGIAYHQLEPAWGAPQDTAEHVRAGCAFALARSRQLRTIPKLNALVDYLHGSRADRINAAKALAATGSESAIPILRQKLRTSDPDAEVTGSCMTALLSLDMSSSIPFVAEFLDSRDENLMLETAAALGVCGHPDAVKHLITAWNRNPSGDIQKELLLSIGLSRNATAIDFLIEQFQTHHRPADLLEALKPACWSEETRTRVRTAVEQLGERPTTNLFHQLFTDRQQNT